MSADRNIFITVQDMNRLGRLLMSAITQGEADEHLRMLEEELDQANLVRAEEVPPDVITMNSKVRIRDLNTGEEKVYELVFPDDLSSRPEGLSVLSPLGTVVLGYRVGDTIERETPGGPLNLKVEELLYQPESAGRR
jgi:regulator of nucleoside diphosphate kinase